MSIPANLFGPSARDLCALFPSAEDLFDGAVVPPADVPSPYRELLVHDQHMTVTVENHHGSLVDVRILARRQDDDAIPGRPVGDLALLACLERAPRLGPHARPDESLRWRRQRRNPQ